MSYEDRFGPLGVVSALVGQVDGRRLTVDGWVLSCRAFSRAIEHHVLAEVARQAGVDEIAFDFVATERNGVVARFLASMGADPERGPSPTIDAAAFSGSDMVGVPSVEMEPAPAAASEE